jgi:DNA-binding transcriptional LysR family regulator
VNGVGLGEFEAALAVAREGSFRGAARALGLSTTALSNAVAKLETTVGVRLFNRTTRSVSLTDAGRAFVEQAGPALRDLHGAMEVVRAQQATPSGTLRINAFASGAREIMAPLVLEFLHRHPAVHVDLVTEGRLVDIVADGFDLGVRRADLVPADMIAVPLGRPWPAAARRTSKRPVTSPRSGRSTTISIPSSTAASRAPSPKTPP